jgi:hypothetical protein
MKARYSGSCSACGGRFPAGTEIVYTKSAPRGKKTAHAACEEGAAGHGPGCYGECDGVYDCSAPAKVIEIRTSGGTFYQNASGKCEDAPCCGCCTF